MGRVAIVFLILIWFIFYGEGIGDGRLPIFMELISTVGTPMKGNEDEDIECINFRGNRFRRKWNVRQGIWKECDKRGDCWLLDDEFILGSIFYS